MTIMHTRTLSLLKKMLLALVSLFILFGMGHSALAAPVTYPLNINDTAYPAMYPNDQTGTFNLFFEREWDAAAYQSIPYVKDVSVAVTYDMTVSIYPSGPALSGGESLPVGTELQVTPLHGGISSSQFINGNGGGWTNSTGIWYPNADFPDGPTGSMLWHFSGGGDPYYQGRTAQCSPQYATNGWFYMMFAVNPTSPAISNSGSAGLMNLGGNRYRITSPGTLDLTAEFPATYGRFYHEISSADKDLTPGCLTSWDVLPAFPVTVTNMGDTDFDGFDDFSWGEDRSNPITLTIPAQQVSLSFNVPVALPQCSDGNDNDLDGATDFPADSGCTGPADNDETDPVAGFNVTVTAIECDDESYLPDRAGGANIISSTAANFVLASGGNCQYHSGLGIEWGGDSAVDPPSPNTFVGPAGATRGWTTLGTTGSDGPGKLSGFIPYNVATMPVGLGLREMLPAGYVPFSGDATWDNPSYSAEFYCNKDVEAYDNTEDARAYEIPASPTSLTFDCVAWNAPLPGASISVTPSLSFGPVSIGTSKMLPITITHTGGGSVTGTFIPPGIGLAGTYACQGNPSCSFTVNSGSPTATLNIILTANQVASLGGVGNIISSDVPQQNVTITGMGDDKAILEVYSFADSIGVPTDSPSPFSVLPFGNIFKSGSTQQRQFTVTNIGATPLSYDVELPTTLDATYYTCSGDCSGAGMTNGQKRNFTITFDPDPVGGTVGDKSATVNVKNTSGVPGGVTPIELDFQANIISNQAIFEVFPGTNPNPNVTVTAIAGGFEVDFGSIPVYSTRSRDIVFYNDGDIPMDVSYLGSAALPFLYSMGNQSNIPAGSFHTLSVDFNPQVAGNGITQIVTVTTDGYAGGTVIVVLKGDAYTQPELTLTVPPAGPFSWGGTGNLDFGNLDVSASPIFLTIDIENTGSDSTTVSFAGGESSYTIVPVTTNTIPAGETRSFRVYFDPAPGGPYPEAHSGTFIVSATGLAGNSLVIVNGFGIVLPPALDVFPPSPIDFGRVIVGKTKSIAVTITNNDFRDFGFPTMAITGADAGSFTCVECDDVGVPLGPTEFRTLHIIFAPTTVGDFGDAQLTFIGGQNGISTFTIDIDAVAARPTIKYEEN